MSRSEKEMLTLVHVLETRTRTHEAQVAKWEAAKEAVNEAVVSG